MKRACQLIEYPVRSKSYRNRRDRQTNLGTTEMLTLVRESPVPDTYELLFATLEGDTRGIAFPCDVQGHVDLDALSDSSRNTYFYARAVVGRVFARPAVQRRRTDHAGRIEADSSLGGW